MASFVFVLASAGLLAGCSDADESPDPSPLGDRLAIDEELVLQGVSQPVDVVRDVNGRTHIYAYNVHDAMLAQGYLVARDRHVQLELMRRLASGRIAEMFGALAPSLIDSDYVFRQLGFHRVAQQIYDATEGEMRQALDAFSSGVSQLFAEIQSGERPFARGVTSVDPSLLTPWTGADTLTMGRLFTWELSYSGDEDIDTQQLHDDLRATFSAADADPLVQARTGIERDYIRFEPPDHATTVAGLEVIGEAKSGAAEPGSSPQQQGGGEVDARMRKLVANARGYLRGIELAREWLAPTGDFGSNNWAVGPARSTTGNPLLASDPHLELSSPSTFWPVSIHVDHPKPEERINDIHVGGIAFPGVMGIILGHNEHVGWGATVAGYDVTDIYSETLTADGKSVVFEGKEVPLETIDEVIVTGDGSEVLYSVQVVPHHGPIVPNIVDGKVVAPDPDVGAMSVRWTGLEPTREIGAVMGLMRARDVDEAHEALKEFGVGAQNWMLADTNGNIAWTSHALVPYRAPKALEWDAATGEGKLPCFVLPGDGTAEWTGYWADDAVPWAKNPLLGYLATANQDPVGGTLDNDPSDDVQPDGTSAYLACSFARGHRQGRIKQLLEGHDGPLSPEDMSAIQGDHRSVMGSKLVPALLLAIENAQKEKTGGADHPDLEQVVADPAFDLTVIGELAGMLTAWRDEADYAAASGVNPDDNQPLPLDQPEAKAAQATLLFNAWLVRFMARTFGDELARIGRERGTYHHITALLHLMSADAASLATYDATTGDSALWDDIDTVEVESRQERMIRALLDALTYLQTNVGAADTWRWGQHHTITFETLSGAPFNHNNPSPLDDVFAGGFPRHGDMDAIDACKYGERVKLEDPLNFTYGSGPTQRFVIDMDPQGVKARNALPGGAVLDLDDPHFADQAEQWRRNQVHEVPFKLDDVIGAAETRTVIRPSG